MGKKLRLGLCLELQVMVVRTVLGIVELLNNVRQDNVQNSLLIVSGQIGQNLEHVQNRVEEEIKPGNELS